MKYYIYPVLEGFVVAEEGKDFPKDEFGLFQIPDRSQVVATFGNAHDAQAVVKRLNENDGTEVQEVEIKKWTRTRTKDSSPTESAPSS